MDGKDAQEAFASGKACAVILTEVEQAVVRCAFVRATLMQGDEAKGLRAAFRPSASTVGSPPVGAAAVFAPQAALAGDPHRDAQGCGGDSVADSLKVCGLVLDL